mgnify:CR=1 FL=1
MTSSSARSLTVAVALLAEGVDRNFLGTVPRPDALKSPSSRRAWIEIGPAKSTRAIWKRSPSSRRAWIEIQFINEHLTAEVVALLAEGVDRNLLLPGRQIVLFVALLAEGVDRNSMMVGSASSRPVALLAEGVDRNAETGVVRLCHAARHPPRRGYG